MRCPFCGHIHYEKPEYCHYCGAYLAVFPAMQTPRKPKRPVPPTREPIRAEYPQKDEIKREPVSRETRLLDPTKYAPIETKSHPRDEAKREPAKTESRVLDETKRKTSSTEKYLQAETRRKKASQASESDDFKKLRPRYIASLLAIAVIAVSAVLIYRHNANPSSAQLSKQGNTPGMTLSGESGATDVKTTNETGTVTESTDKTTRTEPSLKPNSKSSETKTTKTTAPSTDKTTPTTAAPTAAAAADSKPAETSATITTPTEIPALAAPSETKETTPASDAGETAAAATEQPTEPRPEATESGKQESSPTDALLATTPTESDPNDGKIVLKVFADASLEKPVEQLALLFTLEQPDVKITFNAREPEDLDKAIEDGEYRVAKLIDTLALAVPAGNPDNLSTYDSVMTDDVWGIAIGHSGTILGDEAAALLDRIYAWEYVQYKLVFADDSADMIAMLEAGDANCAIMLGREAREAKLDIVGFGRLVISEPTQYLLAIEKNSEHEELIESFLELVRSRDGLKVFESAGFSADPEFEIHQNTDGYRTYIVQPGDITAGIAVAFYGSDSDENIAKIVNANSHINPDSLIVGQELIIP